MRRRCQDALKPSLIFVSHNFGPQQHSVVPHLPSISRGGGVAPHGPKAPPLPSFQPSRGRGSRPAPPIRLFEDCGTGLYGTQTPSKVPRPTFLQPPRQHSAHHASEWRRFPSPLKARFHDSPSGDTKSPSPLNTRSLTPLIQVDERADRTDGPQFSPTVEPDTDAILPAHNVPEDIPRPSYARSDTGRPEASPHFAEVKTEKSLVSVRKAARLAAECRDIAMRNCRPGVTGEHIDELVHNHIISHKAYPSALNFHGFPKSLCISPNEVCVHGIPNLREFQEGDVVSVDCTCFVEGFHGDCAGTAIVGEASQPRKDLVAACRAALYEGIAVCRPGVPLSVVAKAISEKAKQTGHSVIHQFCGHFIGEQMHQPPLVHHVPGPEKDQQVILKAGMVFTIEPVFVEGSARMWTWEDGWTVATADNGFSANWEEMVLITDDGCEVLSSIS